MGIQQDSRHKRRATGGKQKRYRKHRKFLLGRQTAHTKLGETRVRQVRVRGGNIKLRALRLDSGIFSWGAEGISRKARIHSVVYNGANNEFVRTNTLVKGGIVQIDAAPFRLWYESYYGASLGKAKKIASVSKKEKKANKAKEAPKEAAKEAPKDAAAAPKDAAAAPKEAAKPKKAAKGPKEAGKKSKTALSKYKSRASKRAMDHPFEEQFTSGYLFAQITSRPGQTGRIDGYLLDGKELEFYIKKTQKKKSQK